MTDLGKAIEYSIKKQIKDNLREHNSRLKSLETFKINYDNSNKAGSTHYINGKLVVKEDTELKGKLDVQGVVIAGGNKLATENFVLQNAVQGEANVELTKVYEETITADNDGKTEFVYNFPGNSVDVYIGGLKLSRTDYTIHQKDGNNPSKIVLNEGAKKGDIVSIVCYGGADIYNRQQTDGKFLTKEDASNTYATKEALKNAVTAVYAFGHFDALTSDRVKDHVLMPLTVEEVSANSITYDNDNDSITVHEDGVYFISWNIEFHQNSVMDTGTWIMTNLFINNEQKTNYDTWFASEKHYHAKLSYTARLSAGDVITFKIHDHGNKLVVSGNKINSNFEIFKIAD